MKRVSICLARWRVARTLGSWGVLCCALLACNDPPQSSSTDGSAERPRETKKTAKKTAKQTAKNSAKTASVSSGRPSVRACNVLVKEMNAVQEGFKNIGEGGAKELRTLAAMLDLAAVRVGVLTVDNAMLAQQRDAYLKMVKDLSKAAKALAKAVDDADAEAMTRSSTDLDAAGQQERRIVDRINELCQP